MKLNKGLFRDISLEEQPDGTWVGGKNLILSNKYSEVRNEPGFLKILDSVENTKVIGVISTSTEFVIFKVHIDNNNNSEIGIYIDGEYIKIIQANLNFNINYPIFGEYYYNYNNELIVVWSDNYNKPRICNLTNIPVTLDPNKILVNQNESHKLDLFSSFRQPIYKLIDIIDSGGNLPSGMYYLTIQYELADGSYGNFLNLSNPITIIRDSSGTNFFRIGGCDDNSPTSKSIKIQISNLDNRYLKFRFGIIYRTVAAMVGYVSTPYDIRSNSNQYIISSLSGLSSIDTSDILIKNATYDKIGAITNIENTLWIGNTQTTEDLKYQKFANNIQIKYVYDTIVSLNGYKGSHKDGVILFDNKGFMPNEIYAFFIRFVYKGGYKTTAAFHIPGRPPTTGEVSVGTIIDKSIYPHARKFHFSDTCNTNGILSYWENTNEKYPDVNEYDGTLDYDAQPILDGINLKNKLVRHHKFPSTRYLLNNFETLVPIDGGEYHTIFNLESPYIHNPSNNYNNVKNVRFNTFNTSLLTSVDGNTKIINESNDPITISLTVNLNGSSTFVNVTNQGQVTPVEGITRLIISKNNINIIEDLNYTGNSHFFNFSFNTTPILLDPQDYITINLTASTINLNNIASVSINEACGIIFYSNIPKSLAFDGTLGGKILGISVSNINIPQYVYDNCESFEILYAQRDISNMTVLSQGMLSQGLQLFNNNEYNRFYDFDLISLNKSFKATHIQFDGYLQYSNYGDSSNVNNIIVSNTTAGKALAKVNNSQYLISNSKYDVVDNLFRESSIYLDINKTHIPYQTNTGQIVDGYLIHGVNREILATLCVFKEDVYSNHSEYSLVNCGKPIPIYSTGIIDDVKIQSGDITYSLLGITRHIKHKGAPDDLHYGNFLVAYNLFPVYSILNPGLRYTGKQVNEIFYPVFNFITNKLGSPNSSIGKNVGGIDSLWETIQSKFEYGNLYEMPEYYSNNLLYTMSNNLEVNLIYNHKANFTNKFPYRVHKSSKQLNESKFQNWRIFKPNEYYESAFNRGEIITLSSDGIDLLILHKYSLFIVRNITSLQINSDVVSSLGSAELFNTPPIEIMYNKVGYVGCQSKFGVLPFKYGVLIIDRFNKKIFIYNQLKVEEISVFGVQELFLNILNYNESIVNEYPYYFNDGEIIQFDNNQPVTYRDATLSEKMDVDNPFTQFGYHATWDDENSRILITKVDIGLNTLSNDSFTISYYPELKLWGFFHSYIPKFSFYNRNGIYFIDSLGAIYKGNNKVLPNSTFDQSEEYGYVDSYIDVVFNSPFHLDKLFQSLEWATKYYEEDKEIRDITFNKIEIFNNLRYSGVLDIINDTNSPKFNTRNVTGVWRFNELRDILLNKTTKIVDMNNIDILNTSHLETDIEDPQFAIDWATNWYDKNLMIDTFIIVRLHFNKLSDPLTTNNKITFKIFNIGANSNIIKR